MKSFAFALALVGCLFSGCAYSVHEVHTSDFNPYASIESGKMVRGFGEQFVLLGFVDETNYVDQAYQQLMSNCPGGTVSGITTQMSTALGFLSWRNKALMQGLCLN